MPVCVQPASGLIATNTIAQGDTRQTGLAQIEADGGVIYWAANNTLCCFTMSADMLVYPSYLITETCDTSLVSWMIESALGEPYSLLANRR